MPHAQDNHPLTLHPIPQHIRRHDRHLAPAFARIAAALGKFGEAVGDGDQPFGEARRGGGVELRNIGNDRFEIGDGLVGPDDAPQAIRRGGGAAGGWPCPSFSASA